MLVSPGQGASAAFTVQRCEYSCALDLMTPPCQLCFLHSSPQQRRADSRISAASLLCIFDRFTLWPAAAAAGRGASVHLPDVQASTTEISFWVPPSPLFLLDPDAKGGLDAIGHLQRIFALDSGT